METQRATPMSITCVAGAGGSSSPEVRSSSRDSPSAHTSSGSISAARRNASACGFDAVGHPPHSAGNRERTAMQETKALTTEQLLAVNSGRHNRSLSRSAIARLDPDGIHLLWPMTLHEQPLKIVLRCNALLKM